MRGEERCCFNAHSAPSGKGTGGGWWRTLIVAYAHKHWTGTTLLKMRATISTCASECTVTHTQRQSCTGGALYEVCTQHQKDTSDISDRSQMMMHRDLLPLRRQNKRTDMKEKSINIRRLIKHFFFWAESTTKVFFVIFFPPAWHKENRDVLGHETDCKVWQQSSHLCGCEGTRQDNGGQHFC